MKDPFRHYNGNLSGYAWSKYIFQLSINTYYIKSYTYVFILYVILLTTTDVLLFDNDHFKGRSINTFRDLPKKLSLRSTIKGFLRSSMDDLLWPPFKNL